MDTRGGFMSCHDWRTREYNAQADAVGNWVFDNAGDVEALDVPSVARRLASGEGL